MLARAKPTAPRAPRTTKPVSGSDPTSGAEARPTEATASAAGYTAAAGARKRRRGADAEVAGDTESDNADSKPKRAKRAPARRGGKKQQTVGEDPAPKASVGQAPAAAATAPPPPAIDISLAQPPPGRAARARKLKRPTTQVESDEQHPADTFAATLLAAAAAAGGLRALRPTAPHNPATPATNTRNRVAAWLTHVPAHGAPTPMAGAAAKAMARVTVSGEGGEPQGKPVVLGLPTPLPKPDARAADEAREALPEIESDVWSAADLWEGRRAARKAVVDDSWIDVTQSAVAAESEHAATQDDDKGERDTWRGVPTSELSHNGLPDELLL